jgi:cytochrome P450
VFENPGTFDPQRPNARDHVSFSAGHHRCLGSPLAKIEIEEILNTIAERMPDLRIDEGQSVRYPTIGGVDGYSQLPATFIPGERVDIVHPDPAYATARS